MRFLHYPTYRRWIIALLTALLALAVPINVWAHPLGNFTINHYAGLLLTPSAVTVDYVLDMAEIPAFQEIARFDANRDGQPQPAEFESYPPQACEAIRSALDLRVNGLPASLALDSSAVEFPPGAGGLLTLRLTCAFNAPLALTSPSAHLSFSDNSYAERLGWREVVVTSTQLNLAGDFATTSPSQRLTAYPNDLLSNPLDQRRVTITLSPTNGAEAQSTIRPESTTTTTAPSNRSDAFTQLITLERLDFPTVALALAVAFVWGAMHALTPGHGKTIVGAYLVGSRGTAKHALYLGLTTTITHTAGVFALGLVTLLASHYVVPEKLFPWLSFISGALIVGLGLNLLVSRLRSASSHHHHDHPHLHTPTHDHHHPHDHDHDHGSHGHSHPPPGVDGAPVTWRSLLALGVSGGLLPCPSALVVMLSAIALDKIAFGLVLVIAFSLGLAGVLTGLGLTLVYAGRLFNRFSTESWVVRLLPAASALFITLAGVGITAQALVQLGWIKV